MQCKYVKRNGSRCHREALPNSERGYCLLHEDLNLKDEEETKKEFYREINTEISDFEGCILSEVNISNRKFPLGLNFRNATIEGNGWFNGAIIEGDTVFEKATIKGDAWFDNVKIKGDARFDNAMLKHTSFEGATLEGDVYFEGATIEGPLWFSRATIKGNVWFLDSTLKAVVGFKKATIEGYASFDGAKIEEYIGFFLSNIYTLTFKNTKFKRMSTQETACRTARRTLEQIGNRVLADYHFYREMEAKRKQKYKTFSLKPFLKLIRKLRLEKLVGKHIEFLEKERRIYWGFLELPVQYIFGYGVYPWRVIATWLLTVFSLAFVYWIGKGVEAADSLWEYIYFSVVTAATPGYGGYHPNPGFFQGLASFEAIFGTFMWAAFIATFARKYMR
jgi:uncharacterized protein YjbI with pentapeptide repeats